MEREDANANAANGDKPVVCILDASTYVGFWILQGMLSKGYNVHAAIQKNGEGEIVEKIRDMEVVEDRLVFYSVEVLDYRSILEALKGCAAVFCCLDSLDGYSDEKNADLEVRGAINVVEACAQTESIDKIVFSSSLMAAIWKDNISSLEDVDERSWSDPEFCRKLKRCRPLANTTYDLNEQGRPVSRGRHVTAMSKAHHPTPGRLAADKASSLPDANANAIA
ncbi:hypothetical protein NL676_034437 [Syzygium grande]|nr:hypothetical protein NL676_034437 [Syzygium grande]